MNESCVEASSPFYADAFLEKTRQWLNRNPLRVWRLTARVPRSFVAGALRVSPTTVGHWEAGQRPSLIHQDHIAVLSGNLVRPEHWDAWEAQKPVRED